MPNPDLSLGDPEFRAGDRIQTEIGEFEVQQVLGAGGMGVVYQVVRDERHGGRQFALKTILPELLNRREVVDRFETEGRVLAKFDQENIIKIDGIFTMFSQPPRPFILMELLQGYTLRYVMDEYDGLPINDVCTVAIGVCNAFDEIHKSGVVHRDVKPENIFIQKRRKQTRVVLIDFGIMKLVLGSGNQTKRSFLGSYGNASPEQLLGKEVTPRSDFYSLGTVLYEMLTGGPLFPDVSESHAIGLAHVSRQPVPLRERAPHVPREIADIVMRALEKDPGARPKDAYAFRQPFTTERNRFLRDQAQSAGHSTIERFLTNTVGVERLPVPSKELGGGTAPLVAARPRLPNTTALSDVPYGTQPDRAAAMRTEPIVSSGFVPPGVTRPDSAAQPALERSPTSVRDGAPLAPVVTYENSVLRTAPQGLAAIPVQPPADPSTPPGTDSTSSHDLPGRDSFPRVAHGGDGTEERVDLPLRRPLLPRVLLVIAVGVALSVGALFVRRALVHGAAPPVSAEAVQGELLAPTNPAPPTAPVPLPPGASVGESSPSPVPATSSTAAAPTTSASAAEPPASGHAHHSGHESVHAPAAPASKPAPTSAASASAKPDCTKNYTVDADGNKFFRPECFPGGGVR